MTAKSAEDLTRMSCPQCRWHAWADAAIGSPLDDLKKTRDFLLEKLAEHQISEHGDVG